ncbi:esterase-like activity of phytase family protein [Maritimibacter fusiformis]|uniref:Esterase-like activity of phytase family protein n=1 Tax=Maritimibacter fusiformis TaxID=2603819 RepID=A0A5D0RMA1_9RHOB|nr:esterase-like activity of phytase family protein [Maritimibacter fusiformis]TYB81965.1 esterase-like activity of phytase family protein [Maritimibacter fusiformis]
MHRRLALAITAAVLLTPLATAQPADIATFSSRLSWTMDDRRFGGWSGLELSPDGSTFVMVSDRANILTGRIERDENGLITGVQAGTIRPLKYTTGGDLPRYHDDSEGLAMAADGRIYVSFESVHRVVVYDNAVVERAIDLPRVPDYDSLQNNSSLEALAIDEDGAIYIIPERSGEIDKPFPVHRLRGETWETPYEIPRRGEFLVVGADIGPDGRLYVLERALSSMLGFSSRVRRFDMSETALTNETTLFTSPAGRHDNLEGVAVWRDTAGHMRVTMVSDDNFRFFQTTEFVEYVVPE